MILKNELFFYLCNPEKRKRSLNNKQAEIAQLVEQLICNQ